MFKYKFSLSKKRDILTLELKNSNVEFNNNSIPIIGTVGDNNVQEFDFSREGYENLELVLLFSSANRYFPEYSVDENDIFILPNTLTQSNNLIMQAQIKDGNSIIASSQKYNLYFRDKIQRSNEPLQEEIQFGELYTMLENIIEGTNKENSIVSTFDRVKNIIEEMAIDMNLIREKISSILQISMNNVSISNFPNYIEQIKNLE